VFVCAHYTHDTTSHQQLSSIRVTALFWKRSYQINPCKDYLRDKNQHQQQTNAEFSVALLLLAMEYKIYIHFCCIQGRKRKRKNSLCIQIFTRHFLYTAILNNLWVCNYLEEQIIYSVHSPSPHEMNFPKMIRENTVVAPPRRIKAKRKYSNLFIFHSRLANNRSQELYIFLFIPPQ
jgi:hypothetical protein